MKEEKKKMEEELPKEHQEKCEKHCCKDHNKKHEHHHECECQKENENKTKELNEKVLRLSAEMQNMRRRYEEEKACMAKYEGSELIKNLLPILDNFERAIAMDATENEKYLEGFKMVYANMITTLKNIGVEEIDCLHKPFDPKYMEAVLTEEIIEEEQGIVLDVLQKGYMYKDKLLRPAMVKVNE